MIRVFVADDHPLIRRGLRDLLTDEGDIKVVGEAADASEVADALPSLAGAEVLVLDYSMPGRSGLDLIADVRKQAPHCAILMLSMHPEDRFALRAFRAGAAGYLTKDTAPEEIVLAIRKVSTGRKYVSANLAEQLAVVSAGNRRENLPHQLLSDREFQVMCMIAGGKRVREIADDLRLSFRTINTFRARILKKMRMRSNVELTHYALEHKLIE